MRKEVVPLEELIPKVIEFGALAVINVLLIFKGVKAMQDLSETVSKLADKVERMADATNARFAALELDIRELKNAIEALIRRLDAPKKETP